jgi:FKBP-type peptidyl-prolyl cis-trans isomerase FkpA
LDGTVFDKTTTSAFGPFSLNGVIQGWQIGIPLVKAGGRIMLLIPSGLGYGNSSAGSIPANSVLLFTIDVLTVK